MSRFRLFNLNTDSLKESLEAYLLDVIQKENKSFIASLIRAGLFLLSRLFRWVLIVRLYLYKKRIWHDHILGVFVVSIGNLTVGGTGKTPVVEIFADALAKRKKKVAILSRGYKSRKKTLIEKVRDLIKGRSNYPRVVSEGEGQILLPVTLAGDEPYMLAKNLPSVSVVTDKDRVKCALYAVNKLKVDTIILDDGFQRLNISSRLNILLVDSTNPFSNHNLLPLGLLREPIENINRANYIFITKSKGHNNIRHLKVFLRKHNNRAKIIECTHQPKYICDIYTEEKQDLSALNGAKVGAISAIAVPKSFEQFLEDYGAEIVYCERYSDHHSYREGEVEKFIKKSQDAGADFIVTTEKDAVRFPAKESFALKCHYLRIQIHILSGEEHFEECIDNLCLN